jgi:dTDP-glucose 4,6-dehydratase
MKLLVTGGAGFIGSNFIHYMLGKYQDVQILNFDCLTYAGNLENLSSIEKDKRYRLFKGDVTSSDNVRDAFKSQAFDAVVHFAAESHVDRSLHLGPETFILTNVLGTQRLIDACREFSVPRFVHISTDEIYGSLGSEGRFTEKTPLQPNNPYAATKAAADMLVRAAVKSHGLNAVITRCSNNFGPYQFPEKLIPLMITNAVENKPLPVYGDGLQVRDWIYVLDHCRGVDSVLRKGRPGEIYNIGGMHDVPNLDVIRLLLKLLKKPESLIQFVNDRPGHDRRYAMDASKIRNELGWEPEYNFETALKLTVEWYLANRSWWERVRSGAYQEYYRRIYGAKSAAKRPE